ncbi:diaminobutyrate acetyltransferase [Marinomonas sp. THO17]|uniref:diaminobutyrate acetyltransferase n=1 Tax=Marinomonas sp. THO17 TaxID=3149048 RepID=UPI00336BE71E
MSVNNIVFKQPLPEDGASVFSLIENCPPLDINSMYCNLLQTSHFADTCVLAKRPNSQGLIGFVSGYLLPGDKSTLFIWQVAVSASARGEGLAKKMIMNLLAREQCAQVKRLHTTITKNNQASWALFRSLAKTLKAEINESIQFDQQRHFNSQHDTEYLVEIVPISR